MSSSVGEIQGTIISSYTTALGGLITSFPHLVWEARLLTKLKVHALLGSSFWIRYEGSSGKIYSHSSDVLVLKDIKSYFTIAPWYEVPGSSSSSLFSVADVRRARQAYGYGYIHSYLRAAGERTKE